MLATEEAEMNRDVPAAVMNRLRTLEATAEDLADKLARTSTAISSARSRLTGGFERDNSYADVRASLNDLLEDEKILQKRVRQARSVVAACRQWLDPLPDDVVLVVAEAPKPNGRGLGDCTALIKSIQAELASLRAMPTPSADIEQRIKAYVANLARPTITGIGKGETLRIVW